MGLFLMCFLAFLIEVIMLEHATVYWSANWPAIQWAMVRAAVVGNEDCA